MSAAEAAAPAATQDVLPAFVDTVEELLLALHATFPECDKVKKKLLKFRAFVKSADEVDAEGRVVFKGQLKPDGAKMMIKDWHGQFGPFYEICRRRDIDTILSSGLPILKDLDIPAKWADPTFVAEDRECLFQYIDSLNMYAQMQFIPTKMMSRIEQVAEKIATQMQSGNTSLSEIDIFDLGRQVVEGASEDDLMQFAENMGNIQEMMKMQAASLGQDAPPELANITQMMSGLTQSGGGGGGAPDMRLLMKMMGGAMKNLK